MAATVDGATSFPVALLPADPASFGSDCTDVGKVKFVDIFGNGAGAGIGKPAGNVTPLDVPPRKKNMLCYVGLVYGGKRHFQQYFNYIVAETGVPEKTHQPVASH
jgi:hypothetical protein